MKRLIIKWVVRKERYLQNYITHEVILFVKSHLAIFLNLK